MDSLQSDGPQWSVRSDGGLAALCVFPLTAGVVVESDLPLQWNFSPGSQGSGLGSKEVRQHRIRGGWGWEEGGAG